MHPMLTIAVRAARKAGNLIAKHYETPDSVESTQKGTNDFVTNVDRDAEHMIIDVIRKSYPKHTIISEECGELEGEDKDVQWIIDPLDGTTNFVKRFPHFAVSIAVRIKGRTEVAVVYDPMRNELFTASRGQGAQLNGYRLRGTNAKDLDGTILATGFPFKAKQHATSYMNVVGKLFTECADFRRTGSAALDLAYVAAGRVDGFFEIALKPWDFAGGELLVRESGGVVTDFVGGHNHFSSGNIVAGNPRVVKGILMTMRDELSEALKR
ncbi:MULTISPECIES: inositol-1-monophosphatase [Rahnella]|jgi:myo-inositol-1(or 4)-monophosphatase|uniref:Inositol-1-monophosphatase n=2 Tax=Rahnella TaxID=34037 RepID=H2IZ79_RAHAC|nr:MULTISPECIES: inositol-1-monophosphatase [Rahnella]AFE57239.1 inositol monophosphatase [Rahnella aquatilis HX2]ADW72656.1 inositol monophosphatase [Rahnella aceris]AEX50992.1 inositol monophosphatase/fructose-1,6-bisphosphatase family protein [Rahnella aquatilis CIP 78.65 = ATCC 33071]AYA06002.1 inositol-1-monophosphatase [Rahnella aquatilis]AZP41238.1 inositol-1-monophosphatase [Rahnella aquatilis]